LLDAGKEGGIHRSVPASCFRHCGGWNKKNKQNPTNPRGRVVRRKMYPLSPACDQTHGGCKTGKKIAVHRSGKKKTTQGSRKNKGQTRIFGGCGLFGKPPLSPEHRGKPVEGRPVAGTRTKKKKGGGNQRGLTTVLDQSRLGETGSSLPRIANCKRGRANQKRRATTTNREFDQGQIRRKGVRRVRKLQKRGKAGELALGKHWTAGRLWGTNQEMCWGSGTRHPYALGCKTQYKDTEKGKTRANYNLNARA